jgi:hypothetical protein
MGEMTAAHFIYIPVVLLVGLVFGWILGGRAAKDAYLTELRRREERQKAKTEIQHEVHEVTKKTNLRK